MHDSLKSRQTCIIRGRWTIAHDRISHHINAIQSEYFEIFYHKKESGRSDYLLSDWLIFNWLLSNRYGLVPDLVTK